jgi:hypothetical protein
MAKYLTKQLLAEVAYRGPEWDYNQQLDPRAVRALADVRYPVEVNSAHHHRHGQPCKRHMRLLVTMPDRFPIVVDMPVAFYNRLPDDDRPVKLVRPTRERLRVDQLKPSYRLSKDDKRPED